MTTDVILPIYFHHPVDFFFYEYFQFGRIKHLDIGAVAEDGFDKFAKIGYWKMQSKAAVWIEG
jgi:hypothetical protein